MTKLLNSAIKAALLAGEKIIEIYSQGFQIDYKQDNSPLTEADLISNSIIISILSKTDIPIISEENKQLDYSIRETWDLCWIIDPLDGTKEFVKKNGEFTVNIALIKNNAPILGVIYAPVLKQLYYTDKDKHNAYKTKVINLEGIEKNLFKKEDRINGEKPLCKDLVTVVVSKSHMNDETSLFIDKLKEQYSKVVKISKGSSLKFCLVAEGIADIYPRFASTMEWDTAAGQAICEAVGLKVIDLLTNKIMVYNRKELLNNYFLVTK